MKLPNEANAKRVKVKAEKNEYCNLGKGKRDQSCISGSNYFLLETKSL